MEEKILTSHSKNTKAKLDSTSHKLQGVATKLIKILIICHSRKRRGKHGGKSTSLLKQNKHCTHKEKALENNHSKKEQQKKATYVRCNTERAFDLYILDPSQIVKPLNPVGCHTSCSQLEVRYKMLLLLLWSVIIFNIFFKKSLFIRLR